MFVCLWVTVTTVVGGRSPRPWWSGLRDDPTGLVGVGPCPRTLVTGVSHRTLDTLLKELIGTTGRPVHHSEPIAFDDRGLTDGPLAVAGTGRENVGLVDGEVGDGESVGVRLVASEPVGCEARRLVVCDDLRGLRQFGLCGLDGLHGFPFSVGDRPPQ